MSTSFLLGRPIFRCELLVSGSVIPGVDPYPTHHPCVLEDQNSAMPPCLLAWTFPPPSGRGFVACVHARTQGESVFWGRGKKVGTREPLVKLIERILPAHRFVFVCCFLSS